MFKDWKTFAGIVIAVTSLSACAPSVAAPAAPPAPQVSVATPLQQQVTDWDEFTGRLTARERVEVHSRVSGYITQVSFKEGTEVKAGDLLFTIDPRPYEAIVERAEAMLAQAKTTAELAGVEAKNATALRQGQATEQHWSIAAGALAVAQAIEAGAQDLEPGEEAGTTLFYTDPAELDMVSRALPAHGFTVLSAKLGYKPKNPKDPASLSAADLEEVEAFLAAIDGNDDVQNVYVGLAG